MTSGDADRLKKLASDLRCVKCHTRPRLGNIPRCRECLRIDTERELAARPRLLAGGSKPNRQPAPASRAAARKPLAITPTAPVVSKALTVATRPALPAVVTSVVAEPVRVQPRRMAKPDHPDAAALARGRHARPEQHG